jgi:hypothetical protein
MSPRRAEFKFLTAAWLRIQIWKDVALCLWVGVFRHYDRAWRLHFQGLSGPLFFIYQGYPEIKDTNWLGWEGNLPLWRWQHCRVSLLPFQFDFAFKETSGRPDFSRRRRGEKRCQKLVVCTCGGVLWHRNTKLCTQAKQLTSKSGDYFEKSLK